LSKAWPKKNQKSSNRNDIWKHQHFPVGYQPYLILAAPCVKSCNGGKSPTGTHSGPVCVRGGHCQSRHRPAPRRRSYRNVDLERSNDPTVTRTNSIGILFSLSLALALSLLRTVWLELSPHWNPVRVQGTQGPISVELLEKMSRFSNIVKISTILGFFGQAFDKMLFVERVRGVPHRILVA